MIKLFGAIFTIVGCCGVGLAMGQNHRRSIRSLEQLAKSLEWMAWELNCRMPPLAQLCQRTAQNSAGEVAKVFGQLSSELDAQLTPNVSACMTAALAAVPRLPAVAVEHFINLGQVLGQFDLDGQVASLEAAASLCRRDLEVLGRNQQLRLRNYQTLGLCLGVALVILFI